MSSCRNTHGLIASSLYESLDEVDQLALEEHLADCPSCAAEHASLQTLVELVPNEPIAFTGDLRPVLHEALRHEKAIKNRRVRMSILSFSACSLLVFVGFMVFNSFEPSGEPVLEVASNSADLVLLEARALSQAGDLMAARTLLERRIAQEGGSREAAALQLEMADIEFIGFGRYRESYLIYASVRDQYSDVWAQSSGTVKERFDLLTEAREKDFEALYQIDAARKQGESGISALELIMAQYPGRTLAGKALTTMASLVDGEGVKGLEAVKARCTNPIAIAQLDLRLGEAYWQEHQDPEHGLALLEAVADSPYEVPAKMAREILARLMSGDS